MPMITHASCMPMIYLISRGLARKRVDKGKRNPDVPRGIINLTQTPQVNEYYTEIGIMEKESWGSLVM